MYAQNCLQIETPATIIEWLLFHVCNRLHKKIDEFLISMLLHYMTILFLINSYCILLCNNEEFVKTNWVSKLKYRLNILDILCFSIKK